MAKYEINKQYSGHTQTVEANEYQVEGDYFVFYSATDKVLTLAKSQVYSVDLVRES